jgi:membrane-bound lytic murein transglycosylase D
MAAYGRTFGLLALLACTGVPGCARRASAPLEPAAAPLEERPAPAEVPSTAPPASTSPLSEESRAEPPAPAQTQPPAVPSPAQPAAPEPGDSLSEAAFLDTLRTLSADSLARARDSVPPEVVRQEAAALFGPPPAALASAPTWDIDVATYAGHQRVQAYIEYFTGRARPHFEIYLSRLARYDSMIRARLREGGLPQDLVYLAMIESGMNPNAVSRSRAVGMWQFIAETGRRYGLSVDPWVDERRDPFLSTDAAVRFLRELNNRFGSLYLAAAAYNSGPGTINRGLNRYNFGALEGDDVFFALADERFLRRETQDYVPKLIAAAIVAKQPERFGFTDIVPLQPLRYDSVTVDYAVGLDVLARLADTSQAAMEVLNPQLVRNVTPPNRAVWVRVPVGRTDVVGTRLAALPPRERITHVIHSIRRGETLGQISLLYHVSVDDITGANRGLKARSLRIGREIVIPTAGIPSAARTAGTRGSRSAAGARAGTGTAGTVRREQPVQRSAQAAPSRATASGGATPVQRRVHIVRPGETLYGIAEQFNVSLSALLSANRLTARSRIRPGDSIRIPS